MRRIATLVALVVLACGGGEGAEGPWREGPAMQVARSEHAGVVHEGALVVLGGLVEGEAGIGVTRSVEAFRPGAEHWEALPDLPEPRHHPMAAVVEDRLFLIGGFGRGGFEPVDTVWELVDGEWQGRSPLPQPTGAGAAAVVDGAVHVLGGTPCGDCVSRYDPSSDRWSALPPLASPREHTAAVGWEGEVWAIGGRWGEAMLTSVEVLDPSGGAWRGGPVLGEARSGHGAAVTGGGLVVGGGEVFRPTAVLDTLEVLRPGAGAWEEAGARLPRGLHGLPLAEMEGDLFVPGGSTRAGGVENDGALFVWPGVATAG